MHYTYRTIQYLNYQVIQRIEDGAYIPEDINNGDYRHYLVWIAAGNIPENIPYVPPTPLEEGAESATVSYVDSSISSLESLINDISNNITSQLAGKLNISANASALQEKSAADINVYSNPAVQHKHPSACKAWAQFNANGIIDISYGIDNIIKNSIGLWTITFTTSFETTDYFAFFTSDLNSSALVSAGVKNETRALNSIQVGAVTLLGIATGPSGKLYFQAYGNQ